MAARGRYPQLTPQQCAQFLANPVVNPIDPTKKLLPGKGPYNAFVQQCGQPQTGGTQVGIQQLNIPGLSSGQFSQVGQFPQTNLGQLQVGQFPQTGFGQLQFPQTGLPQTGLPQTGLPQTSLGQFNLPQTGLPQTGFGRLQFPQTGLPQTGLPQINLPQTGLPQTGLPQTGLGQIQLPQVGTTQSGASTPQTNLPQFNLSGLGLPQAGLPQFNLGGLPQIGLPQTGLPQFNLGGLPQTGLPQAGLPQFNLPQAGLPQAGLGQFNLPQMGFPQTGLASLSGSRPGQIPSGLPGVISGINIGTISIPGIQSTQTSNLIQRQVPPLSPSRIGQNLLVVYHDPNSTGLYLIPVNEETTDLVQDLLTINGLYRGRHILNFDQESIFENLEGDLMTYKVEDPLRLVNLNGVTIVDIGNVEDEDLDDLTEALADLNSGSSSDEEY